MPCFQYSQVATAGNHTQQAMSALVERIGELEQFVTP
jgi:hypothetical protein